MINRCVKIILSYELNVTHWDFDITKNTSKFIGTWKLKIYSMSIILRKKLVWKNYERIELLPKIQQKSAFHNRETHCHHNTIRSSQLQKGQCRKTKLRLWWKYQWSVGVPSGVPLDRSNHSTNLSVDDVDVLVHHPAFWNENRKDCLRIIGSSAVYIFRKTLTSTSEDTSFWKSHYTFTVYHYYSVVISKAPKSK